MKYYSEEDVMDLIREAEDCERAYEWGEGHRRIHFEDYHPIEIPDKHGRLIDADAFWKRLQKQTMSLWTEKSKEYQYFLDVMDMIKSAPTIVEANNGADN